MSAAVTSRFRYMWHQLGIWREGIRSREARAICPVDSWPFRPRYTEGRCPLCGWEPPGTVVRLPLSRRIDTFGWMVMWLLAVSVVMAVLVAMMYTRA
jgi:hypothetical protein